MPAKNDGDDADPLPTCSEVEFSQMMHDFAFPEPENPYQKKAQEEQKKKDDTKAGTPETGSKEKSEKDPKKSALAGSGQPEKDAKEKASVKQDAVKTDDQKPTDNNGKVDEGKKDEKKEEPKVPSGNKAAELVDLVVKKGKKKGVKKFEKRNPDCQVISVTEEELEDGMRKIRGEVKQGGHVSWKQRTVEKEKNEDDDCCCTIM